MEWCWSPYLIPGEPGCWTPPPVLRLDVRLGEIYQDASAFKENVEICEEKCLNFDSFWSFSSSQNRLDTFLPVLNLLTRCSFTKAFNCVETENTTLLPDTWCRFYVWMWFVLHESVTWSMVHRPAETKPDPGGFLWSKTPPPTQRFDLVSASPSETWRCKRNLK